MSNPASFSCLLMGFILSMNCHHVFAKRADSLPARFYVSVMDEYGQPLDGASIVVSVFQEGDFSSGGMSKREYFRGISKSQEPMPIRTETLGLVIFRVDMDGYYTHLEQMNLPISDDKRRYEPWNGTHQIVLKRRINPRPLYVHRVNWLAVPAFDEPIGFDLEKADWVRPHGEGVHGDFIFRLSRILREGEVYEGRMALTFANPMDGIFPVKKTEGANSALLLGREAPLDGYQPTYARKVGAAYSGDKLLGIDDPPRDALTGYEGMWFRVRSEVDPTTGTLQRARYGKIEGFINFEVREPVIGPQVRFVYFLSPDDSRSVEWNGESLVDRPDLQGIQKF